MIEYLRLHGNLSYWYGILVRIVAFISKWDISQWTLYFYMKVLPYTPSMLKNEVSFGQQHGLQSITLTTYFYKDIYQKVIYVIFCESIFQDKSIHIVFTFSNSTT